jgi:hypothetical protein
LGRLILATLIALPLTCLADGIPQTHKDAIREHYTKKILGTAQQITTLQPDVRLYRDLFNKANTLDTRDLLPADEIPWAQLFKGVDLSLGEVIRLTGNASGYDSFFDPRVNQSQIVKLNSHPNSLADVAEYLTRVTDAQITLYPETRSITVTLK